MSCRSRGARRGSAYDGAHRGGLDAGDNGYRADESGAAAREIAPGAEKHRRVHHAGLFIYAEKAVALLLRQEIVYRANPYEFQYYWYRLWASKPRKMLGELINSHLRYTNLFQHVSSTIEDKLPDYLLDIDISAIEELDVSDTEWYAHLALRFTLSRPEDNTTAWTYQFDAKRPVASNQPVYVVKAMSELLDAELVKAFQDLDNALGGKTKPAISDTPNKAVTEPPQATLLNKP